MKCSKCGRYYAAPAHKVDEIAEKSALGSQSAIAIARLTRVVCASGKGWNAVAAAKAMTRGTREGGYYVGITGITGWNLNTGVHLFGKAATYGGATIQIGVGAYRVITANDTSERIAAAAGTGISLSFIFYPTHYVF